MKPDIQSERKKITPDIFSIVLFIIFCVAYFPVMQKLVIAWSSTDEYSHGFLILPISLYIAWNKLGTLKAVPKNPSWVGLVIIICSLLLYIISSFAEIVTVTSFSMITVIMGFVIYFYGLNMFKALIFPLFFLFFMIPIPAQIFSILTIPLQLFVSKVSVYTASMFGLPIFREGNVIHLPEKTLQVVQACSGLRSLISLVTLSTFWGYLSLNSNLLRGLLIVCAIPAAIIINVVRVFLMIISFYYFNIDLTKDSVHTWLGILIFALALALIYIVQGVLSRWDKPGT